MQLGVLERVAAQRRATLVEPPRRPNCSGGYGSGARAGISLRSRYSAMAVFTRF